MAELSILDRVKMERFVNGIVDSAKQADPAYQNAVCIREEIFHVSGRRANAERYAIEADVGAAERAVQAPVYVGLQAALRGEESPYTAQVQQFIQENGPSTSEKLGIYLDHQQTIL